jgi:hypothetical protein
MLVPIRENGEPESRHLVCNGPVAFMPVEEVCRPEAKSHLIQVMTLPEIKPSHARGYGLRDRRIGRQDEIRHIVPTPFMINAYQRNG